MLVVGLTGGLGSGKSTVANAFSLKGVPIIDTDEISHSLTAREGKAIPFIRRAFGVSVFTADGALDRSALRSKILEDATAKSTLESILHPMIRHEVEKQLNQLDAAYALVVIPLLAETKACADMLDRILVVDCSTETQVQRARQRGGWPEPHIWAMISRQAGRQDRLKLADDVIDNDGDETRLLVQVAMLHERYLGIASS